MDNQWFVHNFMFRNGFLLKKIFKNKLTFYNEDINKHVFINSKSILDEEMLKRLIE